MSSLLEWIWRYFENTAAKAAKTVDLVAWLNAQSDAPFADWNSGKGLVSRPLNSILAAFQVQTSTVRLGETTAKGFKLDWFDDAFASYLPPKSNSVTTPVNFEQNPLFPNVTGEPCGVSKTLKNLNKNRHCDGVTVSAPQTAVLVEEIA